MRDFLIIALIIIFSWKLINSEIRLDLSAFAFTDLLALILSLFSVWLAVAFYFKANEASNLFYNNTYRFTSEMSEILGRIEAGFGERLKHLDEGYSGLRDRFDRISVYEPNKQDSGSARDAVEQEKEEIRQQEEQLRQVIENLAERAKLADEEKTQLFITLQAQTKELDDAKIELRRLQREALRAEQSSSMDHPVIDYVARKILRVLSPAAKNEITRFGVQRIFAEIKDDLSPAAIEDLRKLSLLDAEENLTVKATLRIRQAVRQINSPQG